MYVFQRHASFFSVPVGFRLVVTLFLSTPAGGRSRAQLGLAEPLLQQPFPRGATPSVPPILGPCSRNVRARSRLAGPRCDGREVGDVVAVSNTATQEKTGAKAVQRYLRNCFPSLLVSGYVCAVDSSLMAHVNKWARKAKPGSRYCRLSGPLHR